MAAQEGGATALVMETADWTGREGGRFPRGSWRGRLRGLWTGWPRVAAVEAAAEAAAEEAAAVAAAAAQHGAAEGTGAADGAARVVAETATPANFAPFGQVCRAEEDGLPYGDHDAQLDGFEGGAEGGTPRLYLMKLDGPRPLAFDRLTRHRAVSQCLGALGGSPAEADFYLAVHAPAEPPLHLDGVRVFRVAPGTFVKLHRGTWHAGPLWPGTDAQRTFYNLELADTNVVDHHTEIVSDARVQIVPAPPVTVDALEWP